MYLSYLLCINKFGLPSSVSCPGNRNVNDEECLPLIWVSKGCTSVLEVRNHFHMNKILREEFTSQPRFSVYRLQRDVSTGSPFLEVGELKEWNSNHDCGPTLEVANRLVGPVVKASASRAEDPGFEPCL